jgi:phenylacetate-CoA ligase
MSGQSSFHNPRVETLSVDELRVLQAKRLRAIVRHVFDCNQVQRRRFTQHGVVPDDIRGLDDLTKLPTMSRNEFRVHYPLGLSCVDKREIVEMHMSSGSTGNLIVMPYTQADREQWAECMARCLRMAGAEPADIIQITPSFGLFNGGFGFYHGAEVLNLFVLPTGAGDTRRQIRLAKDFGTRIITGIVSFGIRIMETLNEAGVALPDLEIGLFGAETFSDAMKRRISEGLGVEV